MSDVNAMHLSKVKEMEQLTLLTFITTDLDVANCNNNVYSVFNKTFNLYQTVLVWFINSS